MMNLIAIALYPLTVLRRWLRAWRTLEPMDVITGPVSYWRCGVCGGHHPAQRKD
jgi:hypothetical protein